MKSNFWLISFLEIICFQIVFTIMPVLGLKLILMQVFGKYSDTAKGKKSHLFPKYIELAF